MQLGRKYNSTCKHNIGKNDKDDYINFKTKKN